MSKKTLSNYIHTIMSPKHHRQHYLKWSLDGTNDWSIRYFWVFDARPQYQRKWVLKSHKLKHYIELTKGQALEYILVMAKNKAPEEHQCVLNGNKYERLITQHR